MTVPAATRYWRYDVRPESNIESDTFSLQHREIPDLEDGQILVRNLIISMDATNRLWLGQRKELYMDPIPLGASMKGFGLCQVVASKSRQFAVGQIVSALTDWSEYAILDANLSQSVSIPEGITTELAFGVLSIAGPTAYHGMLNLARPRAGETIVITAASGAVGSLAGQIAKMSGCRVVGIAGSEEKCAYLTNELGFDAAVNYRSEHYQHELAQACPQGIDVQFENVGGAILDDCLALMNNYGRVIICGLISMYNSEANVPGPYLFHNAIMKRLTFEGFVILDHAADFPRMQKYLAEWILTDKIKFRLNCHSGLESAPKSLASLYTGENNGKVLVKLAEPT